MKKKKAKTKKFVHRKYKLKPITTKTLWRDGDNPEMTVLEGRHTVEKFAKAYAREGWSGGADLAQNDLRFEWLKCENRKYSKSDVNDLNAKLYTVMDW